MKLNEQQKSLLSLIARSPRDSNGWANVSHALWPSVSKQKGVEELIELIENVGDCKFAGCVRLTNAGEIVLKYL